MSEAVKNIEVPEGWVSVPLSDCAEILDSRRIPLNSKERSVRIDGKSQDQLFPYYGATGQVGFIDDFIFEGEHLLIGEDGAPFYDKSKNVAYLAKGKFWVNNHAHILQALEGVTSNKYLLHYLNKFNYKGFVGGTTRLKLNQANLKQIPVPIAPSKQQKRIVAKIEELFSHIDAGIEALKKAKQLLKQYRQSVLKAAVTGELTKEWREANKDKLEPASQLLERIIAERENDYSRKLDEWEKELVGWKAAGEKGKKPAKPQKIKALDNISDSNISSLWAIPKIWCWIKLGNLAVDVFDGPFGSNLKSKDYVEEGVRVIRLENIGSLEFKDEKFTYITEKKYETLKKHTVSKGDIIFSSFVADGTRVVVLPQNIEKAINKADCFCIRAFGDSINADYLAHFLSTTSTYKRLENQVHGATRPRINTTQLKELEVPFCSDIEQKEIVRLTREKFETIARLETEIDHQLIKTEKNKQSVLVSAFTGQLLVESSLVSSAVSTAHG